MGQDKNTEGSSDRSPGPSCCACMRGGANHGAGGTAGKGGAKKHEQNPAATYEGVKRRASGRRENGVEQTGRRQTAGGAQKKRGKNHNDV